MLALITSALLLLLVGCVGRGPTVVLIPALPNADPDPVEVVEPFKAYILVPLADGTDTVSRKRVKFPAGVWIIWPQPKGDDDGS